MWLFDLVLEMIAPLRKGERAKERSHERNPGQEADPKALLGGLGKRNLSCEI